MTLNTQQSPYLPRQRNFPGASSDELSVEIDKTYIDIASRVNEKTIGLFGVSFQAITGEQWFLKGQPQKQQTIRQVFTFGAHAAGAPFSIPYSINGLDQFTRIYGTCLTDFPDYRPIPYASTLLNANIDIRIDINTSSIVIFPEAASPNIVSGLVVIEWLSIF